MVTKVRRKVIARRSRIFWNSSLVLTSGAVVMLACGINFDSDELAIVGAAIGFASVFMLGMCFGRGQTEK